MLEDFRCRMNSFVAQCRGADKSRWPTGLIRDSVIGRLLQAGAQPPALVCHPRAVVGLAFPKRSSCL